MDLHSFLRSRRSVRRFKPDPVETEVLTRILTTAAQAPSAHNRQPWRFAVITAPRQKSWLADQMAVDFQRDLSGDGLEPDEINLRVNRSKNRINEAPVIVVLCMDASEMDVYPDKLGERAQAERTMAIQSVAAAGALLQLAAHAEGLGSVWICSPLFAAVTVSHALGLPTNWEPQAMFFVGQAASPSKEKVLKNFDDIVKYL